MKPEICLWCGFPILGESMDGICRACWEERQFACDCDSEADDDHFPDERDYLKTKNKT